MNVLAILFAFNGGFVDTVGLLGLHGLFVAHVTGNLVTLAAALMLDSRDVAAKALALPEFGITIALTRLAVRLSKPGNTTSRFFLFAIHVLLVFLFFFLAFTLGPFTGQPTATFLITAGCGVAAMAMQNALLSSYFAAFPPTTFMSGNALRAVLDVVDLACGIPPADRSVLRSRLGKSLLVLFSFICGCVMAAFMFHLWGLASLLGAVLVAAAAFVIAVRPGQPQLSEP